MAGNYHRPITPTPTPTDPPKRTALIALLLLFTSALPTAAQPLPPTPETPTQNSYKTSISPALAILVVAVVSAFFFLAFFSIYIRRCAGNSPSVAPSAAAAGPGRSRRGTQRGLDQALLQTFPTLTYSLVKEHKLGKELLECAVCLCEFNDDDTLRLLPICSHVFHLDCIDVWLASHVTCPVCRCNLAAASSAAADDPSATVAGDGGQDVEELARIGSQRRAAVSMRSRSVGDWEAAVGGGRAGERFRLRLPEEVRREILAAGELRRSASFAAFVGGGEVSGRRGYKEGVGGGGWRSLRVGRSARLGNSARGGGEATEGSGYWKNGIFGSLECISGGRRGEKDDDDGESSTAPLTMV